MIVCQRKVSVPNNLTIVPLHPGAEKRSAVHAAPHHHTQDCNTCVLITASCAQMSWLRHPVLRCCQLNKWKINVNANKNISQTFAKLLSYIALGPRVAVLPDPCTIFSRARIQLPFSYRFGIHILWKWSRSWFSFWQIQLRKVIYSKYIKKFIWFQTDIFTLWAV